MNSQYVATSVKAILLLILLSTFSGCFSYESKQSPDNSSSQNVVVTSIPAPMVTLQSTNAPQMPTVTASPTINRPTSTRANTPQPGNHKPRSPLNPSEAKVEILRLLQSNGECKLPCIWTVEPGTSIDTLDKFFGYYPGEAQSRQNTYFFPLKAKDNQGIKIRYSSGNYVYTIIFVAYLSSKETVEQLTLKVITNEDAQASPTLAHPSLNTAYTIPQILGKYGKPSNILIAPFPEAWGSREDWRPFFLLLVYENDHFMVFYQTNKERIGQDFQGCFSNSQMFLSSWYPESITSWQEALNNLATEEVNPGTIDYFKHLDEVSNWNIEDFYKASKDIDQPVCIKTPEDQWPNIDPAK